MMQYQMEVARCNVATDVHAGPDHQPRVPELQATAAIHNRALQDAARLEPGLRENIQPGRGAAQQQRRQQLRQRDSGTELLTQQIINENQNNPDIKQKHNEIINEAKNLAVNYQGTTDPMVDCLY
jgi:hypothetical protein